MKSRGSGHPWYLERSTSEERHFAGAPPGNWRRYSAGGEWTYDTALFQALVWCWSQVRWVDSDETVTYAELCQDFHCATRASLAPPGSDAVQMPIFAAASRCVAKICKHSLAPADRGEHVVSLNALGMGRQPGIKSHPLLLCADRVHALLFGAALKSQEARGMNLLAFVPDRSVCPAPLWSPGRRRIRGKQKVIGDVADAKPRRVVKSHKAHSSRVGWTPEQLADIAQSTDWRQRQRIEKTLMHDADALERGKHLLAPYDASLTLWCTVCAATSKQSIQFLCGLTWR